MSNFERVIPVLTYQDIAAAHDFLVNAFGFNVGARDLEGHRWWFVTPAPSQRQG